jgi:hypothetical protein
MDLNIRIVKSKLLNYLLCLDLKALHRVEFVDQSHRLFSLLDYYHLVDCRIHDESPMRDLYKEGLPSDKETQPYYFGDSYRQVLIVYIIDGEFKPWILFQTLDNERQSIFKFVAFPKTGRFYYLSRVANISLR